MTHPSISSTFKFVEMVLVCTFCIETGHGRRDFVVKVTQSSRFLRNRTTAEGLLGTSARSIPQPVNSMRVKLRSNMSNSQSWLKSVLSTNDCGVLVCEVRGTKETLLVYVGYLNNVRLTQGCMYWNRPIKSQFENKEDELYIGQYISNKIL